MYKTPTSYSNIPCLSITQRWLYVVISFILVTFGQPAWIPYFGLLAASFGYALFWRTLLCFSIPSQRFWYGGIWFFAVQLVQISWFLSHPYLYIYAVYLFIAALFGLQFGIICIFITPKLFNHVFKIVGLAALWTVLEWSRLFILSGFSFNPIGIALGGSLYSLQAASLFGIYGLSFWVFLTNLLAVKIGFKTKRILNVSIWLIATIIPYLYGINHFFKHEGKVSEANQTFNTVLVQTAFPVEESIDFNNKQNMIHFVTEEWKKILTITKQYRGKSINLIALPEFVVPFGTYANIYNHQDVFNIFKEVLGEESTKHLPPPEWPIGGIITQENREDLMVNNAFWVQALANVFNANVIAGLEDADDKSHNEREYYSSAILFKPHAPIDGNIATRYEKRVLVPMGEYIPFTFCQELAKQYGVFGSFTPGKEAKVMLCGQTKISPSICYEETYGDLIREGRKLGAEVLVNLTSDVWYPNSLLPLQHFEHARFRTVENGAPLIRACNTGVTAAVDCLGRSISVLGGDSPGKFEWVADALYTQVPIYNYKTLYSEYGDKLIIGFSLLMILIGAFFGLFSFDE